MTSPARNEDIDNKLLQYQSICGTVKQILKVRETRKERKKERKRNKDRQKYKKKKVKVRNKILGNFLKCW
jgi:hypothetical protein